MSMSGRQVATWEIGSLGNDDGDGNENGKKAIGLGPVYINLRSESIFISLCYNIPAGKAKRKQRRRRLVWPAEILL